MESYNLFISLQINFCTQVIKDIFGDDWLHYERKWLHSNQNFLYFMSMLDDDNKKKVLDYAKLNAK